VIVLINTMYVAFFYCLVFVPLEYNCTCGIKKLSKQTSVVKM